MGNIYRLTEFNTGQREPSNIISDMIYKKSSITRENISLYVKPLHT